MNILLAIKPKYIEKIANKEKLYEFRKVLPKNNFEKVYVYAPFPISKIVGEFAVETIISDDKNSVWWWCKDFAGITKEQFFNYFSNKNIANAIAIRNYISYNKHIEVKDLNLKVPQNFCYLNDEQEAKIQKLSDLNF